MVLEHAPSPLQPVYLFITWNNTFLVSGERLIRLAAQLLVSEKATFHQPLVLSSCFLLSGAEKALVIALISTLPSATMLSVLAATLSGVSYQFNYPEITRSIGFSARKRKLRN